MMKDDLRMYEPFAVASEVGRGELGGTELSGLQTYAASQNLRMQLPNLVTKNHRYRPLSSGW